MVSIKTSEKMASERDSKQNLGISKLNLAYDCFKLDLLYM